MVVWALPAHTARATRALKGWIIGLVAINLVVSVAIIFLLSTRVHRALQAFLAQMQRVQRGALSGSWQPDSADEFLDFGERGQPH
jgi:nitrate/nitrite-specific signal transduction histidine kinase